MNPEQNNGLTPETVVPSPVKKDGLFTKIRNLLGMATNVSQADALMGTTAGQVLPEATQAASLQAAKNEIPTLAPPATPVTAK